MNFANVHVLQLELWWKLAFQFEYYFMIFNKPKTFINQVQALNKGDSVES